MITSRKLLWEHHIEFLSRDCGEPSKNKCMVRSTIPITKNRPRAVTIHNHDLSIVHILKSVLHYFTKK